MTEQTEQAAVEQTKTVIRPDLKRYVRDKSGNGKRTHRIDDFVARTLAGKSLDVIKASANLLGVDVAKWEKLNAGQQRMLIGNALRNRLNDTKNPLAEQGITDVFGPPVEPYDAEKAAAEAAKKAEEKAAKAAEKAQKKAEEAKEAAGEAVAATNEAAEAASAAVPTSRRRAK